MEKRFRKDASVLTSGLNTVSTMMGNVNCHLDGVENQLGRGFWTWLWGTNGIAC